MMKRARALGGIDLGTIFRDFRVTGWRNGWWLANPAIGTPVACWLDPPRHPPIGRESLREVGRIKWATSPVPSI
jgi:hypothetical protein